jgi:hypothetical protein
MSSSWYYNPMQSLIPSRTRHKEWSTEGNICIPGVLPSERFGSITFRRSAPIAITIPTRLSPDELGALNLAQTGQSWKRLPSLVLHASCQYGRLSLFPAYLWSRRLQADQQVRMTFQAYSAFASNHEFLNPRSEIRHIEFQVGGLSQWIGLQSRMISTTDNDWHFTFGALPRYSSLDSRGSTQVELRPSFSTFGHRVTGRATAIVTRSLQEPTTAITAIEEARWISSLFSILFDYPTDWVRCGMGQSPLELFRAWQPVSSVVRQPRRAVPIARHVDVASHFSSALGKWAGMGPAFRDAVRTFLYARDVPVHDSFTNFRTMVLALEELSEALDKGVARDPFPETILKAMLDQVPSDSPRLVDRANGILSRLREPSLKDQLVSLWGTIAPGYRSAISSGVPSRMFTRITKLRGTVSHSSLTADRQKIQDDVAPSRQFCELMFLAVCLSHIGIVNPFTQAQLELRARSLF